MTLKETLWQELETADDELITAAIEWVRSRKNLATYQIPSGEPFKRGGKLEDLLKFAGTWVGDDLQECLETVYATRSKTNFFPDHDLFLSFRR
jgi:hypothetical protein